MLCQKITADAILFREIQCKKTDISMFWQSFQCDFGWNKVGAMLHLVRYILTFLWCVMSLTCLLLFLMKPIWRNIEY